MMLGGYKIYSVHMDGGAAQPYETAEFVPEGFNIFAFVFGPVWALAHREWMLALLMAGLLIGYSFVSRYFGLNLLSVYIMEIGTQVIFGFFANDARRFFLTHRGYMVADTVAADSLLHAQLRFYDRYLPDAAPEGSIGVPGKA